MNAKLRLLFLSALVLLFATNLKSNNITVSNISLTGENTTDDYVMVQFDLTWENSWRYSSGPANWDAAWVFVKYRVGTGPWQHALLNNAGHTGTGATINSGLLTPGSAFNATTNPCIGAFIYRSADGAGTFSITGAQLRWNYGANGVPDNATVDVKVFAIEMVYVPEGAFAAGSGGSENSAFTLTTINTANATTAPAGSGSLGGEAGGYPTLQTPPDNASWPNGYGSFYCMKYEISQQQYVDFLNTLTRFQQNARTETSLAAGTTTVNNRYVMTNSSSVNYRNGIRCDAMIDDNDPITFYCDLNGNGTGGEAGDGQWIACAYLNWMDGAAYADWAGLRLMTELEYEKACRGTIAPVPYEYAWGTIALTAAAGISNGGSSNETPSNSGANVTCGNSGTGGPLRVGAFATGSSSRTQAGASYYGIMELSGNVWEQIVSVGHLSGRAYTGLHGNGTINDLGAANVAAWPYQNNGEVYSATGSGLRGGNFYSSAEFARVSDRAGATNGQNARFSNNGFRLVRTRASE